LRLGLGPGLYYHRNRLEAHGISLVAITAT
jgi:hypothetical protein